jgi:hypothetical protein
VNMIESLAMASEILSTYSEGTLPAPKYVTVNAGPDQSTSIGFLMNTSADVEMWSFATDSQVRRTVWEGDTQFSVNFQHGHPGDNTVYVNVFYVKRAEEKISA